VAAADIYWDYIGTDGNDLRYRITLVLFKACEPNNAGLGTTAQVRIYAPSCGSSQASPFTTLNLPMVVGPDTMDQLCANFKDSNTCRTPTSPWPGFERRIYIDVVTLPQACVDWTADFQLCCRNAGILNIGNGTTVGSAGNYQMYTYSTINNVAKYNNNSPRFIVDPIPYLCVNQPNFFLNGPFDPDNDSLSTLNVQPWDNWQTPIPYMTTPNVYSQTNPLLSSAGNPYTVNVNTGTASFTPTLIGKFVLAFEVSDYMRTFPYSKLGTTRRDVQLSILQCNAGPPDINYDSTSIAGGAKILDYFMGCAGSELKFDVQGNSNTISNQVILSSNNNQVIPASTFTVAGQNGPNPIGTFSWTPSTSDVGDYTIIFIAKDSTCNNNQPIVLQNYWVAFIRIFPPVDAGPDGKTCKIDGTPWQLNATGGTSTPNWKWTALDGSGAIGLTPSDAVANPKALPPYNFEYVVTDLNFLPVCKNRDTVMVWIDTSNSVTIVPDAAVVCRPGYFQLDAVGIGLPPLANLQCGTSDIVTCTTEDTLIVETQDGIGAKIQSKILSPFLEHRSTKAQFLLTSKDLRAYGIRSATLRGLALDVASVGVPNNAQYNNLTISLKCTDRTDLSAATGGPETGATLVYSSPTPVNFALGWKQFNFDLPYSVDSTKSLVVEFCYSNSSNTVNAALPQINVVPTGSTQTVVTFSNVGSANLCTNPNIASTTQYYPGRPVIRFNMCTATTVPFAFTWTPGEFLSDSTTKSPLAYINRNMTYQVQTIGRNGCKVRDTINILQPVRDYDIWPKDTSFCIGESFKMKALGDFSKVRWFEVKDGSFNAETTMDCDDCSEPIATPNESTVYAAVMSDQYDCSDTMFVNSVVKPLPSVNIINRDTILKYGQSIQLLVSGAYLYTWFPVSTLTNPNIAYPWATPTEPTMYYVWGLAENGCRNIDSVIIDIDYRDNLFVPTAFSPNGDGKNDVFRVSNITFQKLQEFRVFNRWGQEIYSTTDPIRGWDGSWKGVPQDMGVYQYLIKVAYPDGYIETYKGDVSLIR